MKLRLGLVLGGEEFFERVRKMVKAKAKPDELRWTIASEDPEARQATARRLAEQEDNPGAAGLDSRLSRRRTEN